MTATVVRIDRIDKHPNADNLELLQLSNGVTVVTGPHYQTLQLGVYIAPGCLLPGYLAQDLWLVKKGDRWVKVESRIMRGIESPGLFAGAYYRNKRTSPVQNWLYWQTRWQLGDDVAACLGIVTFGRGSSTSEQQVSNLPMAVQLGPLAPPTYEVLADLHEQASGHKCNYGCDSQWAVACNCQGRCTQHVPVGAR